MLRKKMEEKNMNNKNKMSGLSLLLALSSVVMIASGVQAEANASTVEAYARRIQEWWEQERRGR